MSFGPVQRFALCQSESASERLRSQLFTWLSELGGCVFRVSFYLAPLLVLELVGRASSCGSRLDSTQPVDPPTKHPNTLLYIRLCCFCSRTRLARLLFHQGSNKQHRIRSTSVVHVRYKLDVSCGCCCSPLLHKFCPQLPRRVIHSRWRCLGLRLRRIDPSREMQRAMFEREPARVFQFIVQKWIKTIATSLAGLSSSPPCRPQSTKRLPFTLKVHPPRWRGAARRSHPQRGNGYAAMPLPASEPVPDNLRRVHLCDAGCSPSAFSCVIGLFSRFHGQRTVILWGFQGRPLSFFVGGCCLVVRIRTGLYLAVPRG
ncbi:hypothetical protein BKA62DRAFT_178432 [Auriculariales sp. MPI-PUGE-AT-0066]|nr:hypothetical protein BKA62DRAFT_178432 [Auriculariales sp. MPI-PUGE-AT-0066]